MRPFFIGITAAVLLSTIAVSADDNPPPQVSDEIVVTASALPERADGIPATVTVVTRQQLEQRAARDLADVLREVPGLTISRTGSAGRATSLFTRGSNSTHTLVLWNGVPINNPYFSGYDWGRFPTTGVEQVEVVRGPFSALYGSEAVAGVVNVLTAPSHSGVRGEIEAGTHGLRNGQAGASYVAGTQLFTVSADKRQDDGFAANDDFDQNSANVFWKWTASRFALGLAGRYTSYDLGVPINLNAAGTALVASPRRRQSGNERQLSIPMSQSIGSSFTELTLSESRRSDDFDDPDDPYGYVTGTTESTSRRARLSSRFASAAGTLVVGGELARAAVTDRSNFGATLNNSGRRERALFVEDRFSRSFDRGATLELSAGVRYDHFDSFGSQTSPRVAAAWVLGRNKFRAAYGEAFRAPSVGELYFPFSGNRDLRAERTESVEAGYDFIGTQGELNVTVFRSRFRDLIVFDNATYAFSNIGRATSSGVEVAASRNITAALRVSASYTYLDTNELATGKPLLRRPRNSGSLFAAYRAGNVETNLVIAHTGQRFDVLPVGPFNRISDRAYTTVDVNVQARLDRVTPYVKIENAGDVRYEEVRGYPSPRRRASVGIRFAM